MERRQDLPGRRFTPGEGNVRAKLTDRQRRIVISLDGVMAPHEIIKAIDLEVTPEAIYNIWRRARPPQN